MYDLILASASPYRKQQLAALGYVFRSVAPMIDEKAYPDEPPNELVLRLATLKATTIAEAFSDSIVIGSDQTGYCNGQLLRKPKAFNRALEMLLSFRQQTVYFYSAVVVSAPNVNTQSDVITTAVQFREFTEAEAIQYIRQEQPLDCVGAFKSESRGPLLFNSVRSEDPTALIGLPTIRTAEFLRELGLNPLLETISNTPQSTQAPNTR